MTKFRYFIYLGLLLIISVLVFRLLNTEPEVIIKTKTKYIKVTDTIVKTVISEPEVRYIYRNKDSIIYVDNPTSIDTPLIKANQYETKLFSNNATANLQVLTTGNLLDVQGNIVYEKEFTTVEKTIYKENSGLFLYTESSIIPKLTEFRVGVDYSIKNAFVVGTSVGFNTEHSQGSLNVKLGVRIF